MRTGWVAMHRVLSLCLADDKLWCALLISMDTHPSLCWPAHSLAPTLDFPILLSLVYSLACCTLYQALLKHLGYTGKRNRQTSLPSWS